MHGPLPLLQTESENPARKCTSSRTVLLDSQVMLIGKCRHDKGPVPPGHPQEHKGITPMQLPRTSQREPRPSRGAALTPPANCSL